MKTFFVSYNFVSSHGSGFGNCAVPLESAPTTIEDIRNIEESILNACRNSDRNIYEISVTNYILFK